MAIWPSDAAESRKPPSSKYRSSSLVIWGLSSTINIFVSGDPIPPLTMKKIASCLEHNAWRNQSKQSSFSWFARGIYPGEYAPANLKATRAALASSAPANLEESAFPSIIIWRFEKKTRGSSPPIFKPVEFISHFLIKGYSIIFLRKGVSLLLFSAFRQKAFRENFGPQKHGRREDKNFRARVKEVENFFLFYQGKIGSALWSRNKINSLCAHRALACLLLISPLLC
jgi:hypothetical protein